MNSLETKEKEEKKGQKNPIPLPSCSIFDEGKHENMVKDGVLFHTNNIKISIKTGRAQLLLWQVSSWKKYLGTGGVNLRDNKGRYMFLGYSIFATYIDI